MQSRRSFWPVDQALVVGIGSRQHGRGMFVALQPVSALNPAEDGQIAVLQRTDQLLIGPVIDIDEPEIVILAVRPAAGRLVGISEQMDTDYMGSRRKEPRRPARPLGALSLRCYRHQMTSEVAVVTERGIRRVRITGAVPIARAVLRTV